ncbi:hypothetical protein [Nostoc sp. DedQUE07]|uniref:hypothetical protein n=1 Tax=Nostoc sp. DedQUE07 TaxID=3075392 RepID=UPI002AD1F630|nr:hypothetical protein [Nostoc sp. DedQUE07]MDZ8128666.1 hypothetical protein [Nostoc sp. DedQUE07]
MPASVPMDDGQVQTELTRYLEDNWVPVIEKDVDGYNSLPLACDRQNPNLGRYSACRRVARTIYLGSAPTLRAVNRGVEDHQLTAVRFIIQSCRYIWGNFQQCFLGNIV